MGWKPAVSQLPFLRSPGPFVLGDPNPSWFGCRGRHICPGIHPPYSSCPTATNAAQSGTCNQTLLWSFSTSPKQTAAATYRKLSNFLALSRMFPASSTATAKHAMDLSSASSFPLSSCEPLTMQSTEKATSRSNVSFISIDISRRRWFRTPPLLPSRVPTKTSSSLMRCAGLVLYW